MFWTIDQLMWDVEGGGAATGGDDGGGVHSAIMGAIESAGGTDYTPEPPPDPEADAEEKEIAALQSDWRAKNPNARGNIAIDRHQAVLTRTRNQHQKAAEEWAAKEKAWQEAEKKYKGDLDGWGQYEWAKNPNIAQALQAIALAETDQKAFAELLLSDPRFAEILSLKGAEPAKPQVADRPKPNQQSPDGSFAYYDDDGIGSLLDWHGQKVTAEALAQAEAKHKKDLDALEKRFEEKYGKVADAYEHSTRWSEAEGKSKQQLEHMRANWAGFKDHEKAMKVLLDQNIDQRQKEYEQFGETRTPAVTMEQLYIQVVVPELQKATQVNEAAMREKILAELKGRPAAASGSSKKTGAVERSDVGTGEDRPIADVIRASIAHLRE